MTDYAALAQATIGRGKRLQKMYDPEATRRMRMDAHAGKSVLADLAKRREVCEQGIPGFFPTPKALAREMVARLGDIRERKVGEFSAGMGNIADAIYAAGGVPICVELNCSLVQLLLQKPYGCNVSQGDFLSIKWSQLGTVPFVAINPPFEDHQDIAHVKHAFEFLRAGGTMVAIMSEHPFFANHKVDREFRDWLEGLGGESEQLPQGTFLASERPTGVNTRLVKIVRNS
jgi:phospholipid N-methyltransferase